MANPGLQNGSLFTPFIASKKPFLQISHSQVQGISIPLQKIDISKNKQSPPYP